MPRCAASLARVPPMGYVEAACTLTPADRTMRLRPHTPRLLLVAALGACAPAAAPGPDAPTTAAESTLMRHLSVLAADSMEGRRAGTAGAERARRYLLAEFQRAGLEPVGGTYEHPFTVTGRRDGATHHGVNLLGQVRGTRHPERVIVVTAHYDHVGIGRAVAGDSVYNGADDNASGVAALLAMAEHFRRNPPENTLIFAALDAEEVGLQGARALVAAPPVPLASVLANVNMDMVSRSERGELYAAGTAHSPFLLPVLQPVAGRAPITLRFGHDRPEPTAQDDWTLQSDHGAFHTAGIPFVYFGVEDHPGYHQPSDEVAGVTPAFFAGAVATIQDAVRALDAAGETLARERASTRPAAP